MGWIGSLLVQAVITSVLLGALKRAGVVRVDANAIENPGARSLFASAVEMGESVAEAGERMLKNIQGKVMPYLKYKIMPQVSAGLTLDS